MQFIGKRISVVKENDVTSFVILPTDASWKLWLLGGWLFAWIVSGILVATYYFRVDVNTKLVIIMWMAFWAYFAFRTGKAFMFRKFGKEKIWVKGGRLFYWRDIAGRGKKLEFDKELVKDMEVVEKSKDFFSSMNESFWVIGGESLVFSYGAKNYRFGIQLPEADARELLRQLKHALRAQ